jgi:hypothetical protein
VNGREGTGGSCTLLSSDSRRDGRLGETEEQVWVSFKGQTAPKSSAHAKSATQCSDRGEGRRIRGGRREWTRRTRE